MLLVEGRRLLCTAARARKCVVRDRNPQFWQNVGGFFHQLRAVAYELVATPRDRTVDGARDRKHFASLFRREARGDERAAVARVLDHQRADCEAAEEAAARRSVLAQPRGAWRELRHPRTTQDESPDQRFRSGRR